MPNTIVLPCADGTDPQCRGPLSFDLGLTGLTAEQRDMIARDNGQTCIALTPEQMRLNNLSKDGVDEYSEAEQLGWIDIYLNTTCAFCGSDS